MTTDTFKKLIDQFIPSAVKQYYRHQGRHDAFAGNNVFCPICEKSFITFLPFGLHKRSNAQCPSCFSLERHRLIWMYFKQETNLFGDRKLRMLHVAPERQMYSVLNSLPSIEYFPCAKMDDECPDAYPSNTRNIDITSIDLEDDFFDVIYCSHVLEHIPDDRQAMKELNRILRQDGWAILQVPLNKALTNTYEDFSIQRPEDREKHFGQKDHVRVYGQDYKRRLEDSGFQVTVVDYLSRFNGDDKFRLGFPREEDIYFCKKGIQFNI